ncbi:MAG: signal peptidase I [Neisseria sp.]|nr:signal peptidase I [Neisseria sp.]
MPATNNTILLSAAAVMLAGFVIFALSRKTREENGEWGSGLQWGYLLAIAGLFGILASFSAMNFTAVLLIFVVLTGAVWLWHKACTKKGSRDDNHFRDYIGGFFPIILVIFVLRTFVAEPFQIPSSSMRPGLVKGDFILVNKFAYGIRTPVINNVLIDTGKIERGDVVVFNYPIEPQQNYIKRIVGIPGDTIEYRDKVLTVNGKTPTDTAIGNYRYPDDQKPDTVREAEMFKTSLNNKEFDILKNTGQPAVSLSTAAYFQSVIMPEHGYDYAASGLAEHCRFDEDGNGFSCTVPQGRYFAMGDNRDNSADSRYWGFVDDRYVVGKAFVVWLNFGQFGRIGTIIK